MPPHRQWAILTIANGGKQAWRDCATVMGSGATGYASVAQNACRWRQGFFAICDRARQDIWEAHMVSTSSAERGLPHLLG